MGITEMIEGQNEIIRIQSKVIDELYLLLMQHISAEEAGSLPCIEKISQAVQGSNWTDGMIKEASCRQKSL